MPRGDKNPYKGDLKKLNTSGTARRTTQESLDASRLKASGKRPDGTTAGDHRVNGVARPANPELQAWAKGEIESRIKRTVMGTIETKGRSPMYTLSHGQFAEFKATGQWSGDNPRFPTPEEYGPQDYAPEDKEYEKDW